MEETTQKQTQKYFPVPEQERLGGRWAFLHDPKGISPLEYRLDFKEWPTLGLDYTTGIHLLHSRVKSWHKGILCFVAFLTGLH